MMKILICFLLLSLVHKSFASSFDLLELRKMIKDNNLRRIDQLIPLLPQKMKDTGLFVYNSHALNQHLITPETPRVILHNEDATLTLSFTQNPGEFDIENKKDAIEVIHFNQKDSVFEAIEIIFDGTTDPLSNENFTVNPQKCLTCHGSESPRPIMQDYNGWPGFYGSFGVEGTSSLNNLEGKYLKSFLSKAPTMPRYKNLNLKGFVQANNDVMVYIPEGLNSRQFSPVFKYGRAIEPLMRKSFAKQIFKHKNYEKIAPLIAFIGVPEDLKKKVVNSDGSQSQKEYCTGSTRSKFERLFNLAGNNLNKAEFNQMMEKFKNKALTDFNEKKSEFLKFNLEEPYGDSRGLFNTIWVQFFNPNFDRRIVSDPLNLSRQFYVIEKLMLDFEIASDFVTSTPFNPTLGVFHVSKNSLNENEQVFPEVVRNLIQMDPNFMSKYYDRSDFENCESLLIDAVNAFLFLSSPLNEKGTFY